MGGERLKREHWVLRSQLFLGSVDMQWSVLENWGDLSLTQRIGYASSTLPYAGWAVLGLGWPDQDCHFLQAAG
jgi:hypothetical protein